ncbi:glyoxalase/bleomycin resistance/extradiol dioxygenase family protein [Hwangdonia lutea]|uniref:Glyoxalase/bleomycin resistance/extradiol dioxygenase family protein n=1 Tax=Hwangdonia lutea TaxID=3075823 RepID=A0AA97EJP7_9FLAO|nr:glyoxalase/bleomycin resistance/extradiol dioxygenase family protein [Hwangdonia sp. SCSIO 19198]WOD42701.1 glyoxalase/bleomycin resistance/extradiol dioxygenase family protein [Hwangdonia sp. SCSIO 19198]
MQIVPVLPSQNIDRDVAWYKDHVGFELVHKDSMYAVLKRDKLYMHLQWHADTDDDPFLGGSVIKIFVKSIKPFFEEFVKRGTVNQDKLRLKTDWNTNDFGFYDLNKNAIFFVEDVA